MKKSLEDQLQYLYRLERFEEIKPGLLTMERLLSALGNPHHQFRSVHIAGTNGKSSTALLIASSLTAAGYKSALYTSPHLITFNERVRLNRQNIDDQTLAALIPEIRQAARQSQLSPTFFEFTTALAFLYFARQRAEIAIVEVGMGGDLDATNVITPLISVITNIGTDHTAWLGRTKSERARHKAGIIKANIPLITNESNPNILRIFADTAKEKSSPFHRVDQEITLQPLTSSLTHQTFHSQGIYQGTFNLKLLGQHQLANTATALCVLNQLKPHGFPVPLPLIKKTLAETKHPGRLDIVSFDPFILLDGAHNPEGIIALKKFLTATKLPPPDTLLLGLKKDKDPHQVIKLIVPLFRNIIVTEASYQPMPAEILSKKLQTSILSSLPLNKVELEGVHTHQIHTIPNLKKALQKARQLQSPGHMQLITGSLYLIGDTLKLLKQR